MSIKRFSIVLSFIVVLAMLLTACGGEERSTNIPSTKLNRRPPARPMPRRLQRKLQALAI
jgi:hypothetical protein